MKRLMLLGLAFCVTILVQAQKVYFIYLQTEDAAPFFIKMKNEVYSSNYSGYLILSNLTDSTYAFSVGPVPKGVIEPQFSVTIGGKDKGYLIKNFKEYTGLFDLQTLSIIKPLNFETKSTSEIKLVPRTDAFSVMLAMSAGDSSLLYRQVAEKKEAIVETKTNQAADSAVSISANSKPESASITQNNSTMVSDSSVLKIDPAPIAIDSAEAFKKVNITDSSQLYGPAEVYHKSTVTRRSESSTTEGFGLVFIDNQGEEADTIRLFIPNPKFISAKTEPAVESVTIKEADSIGQKTKDSVTIVTPLVSEGSKADSVASVLSKPEHTDLKESSREANVSEIRTDTVVSVSIKVAEKPLGNLSCKTLASDNEFFKLRKNMASRDEDEDMISEARKIFKNRCFTTEQIRNLGSLFLTPGGKYQFFDAAYKHVSDPQNFPLLENEIKDDYNLRRFKALLGE